MDKPSRAHPVAWGDRAKRASVWAGVGDVSRKPWGRGARKAPPRSGTESGKMRGWGGEGRGEHTAGRGHRLEGPLDLLGTAGGSVQLQGRCDDRPVPGGGTSHLNRLSCGAGVN